MADETKKPTPEEAHAAKLKAAYGAAIKKQISGNKDHGWGKDDQLAAIVAVVTAEYGKPPSDAAKDLLYTQVNGSQCFAQLAEAGLLNKPEKGRKKGANPFKEFAV